MKLKPYKEILKMANEAKRSLLAGPRAKKAKTKAQLKIAELEENIVVLESNIHEMCSEDSIDFDKIIDAQDELALLERRKEQFLKIIEELFPEDS